MAETLASVGCVVIRTTRRVRLRLRTFDRETVRAFAQLVAAVRDDQREGIAAALVGLGGVAPDDDPAWEITRTVLRDFFGPLLSPGKRPIEISPTRRDVSSLMRDKRAVAKLALPGRLLAKFSPDSNWQPHRQHRRQR